MTARKRGNHFCYQKHFLFFRRRRDFLHAHLCAVLLLGCSLLAYAWPWHCAGLSLAFRKIIESVVVFWHGFFFLFAELVQFKNHCTFTLRNTLIDVGSTTQNTTHLHTLATRTIPFTLTLVHYTYRTMLQTTCTLRSLMALITFLPLLDWMGCERST